MWPNPQFPADLVTFTEEILSDFMCFDIFKWQMGYWANTLVLWKRIFTINSLFVCFFFK